MSYGMMIAVQMNRKAEFDAIWNWSKTYCIRLARAPVVRFFLMAGADERTLMSEFVRRMVSRIMSCPLLCREPLGQRAGITITGRGRPVVATCGIAR